MKYSIVSAALVALAVSSAPVCAAEILDQDVNTTDPTGSSLLMSSVGMLDPDIFGPFDLNLSYIQSVTAGKSGELSRIDLGFYKASPFDPGIVRLSLFDGDASAGAGSLIGSLYLDNSKIPESNSKDLFSVDVSSFHYAVAPGQMFSFGLENLATTTVVNFLIFGAVDPSNPSTQYGGGKLSIYDSGNPVDFGQFNARFSTYVDPSAVGPVAGVPEPANWSMMILGFGAVGGAMRLRRRARAQTVFAV